MKGKKLAMLFLAATVSQGLCYPSIALAQQDSIQDIPTYESSEAAPHDQATDTDPAPDATGDTSQGDDTTTDPAQPNSPAPPTETPALAPETGTTPMPEASATPQDTPDDEEAQDLQPLTGDQVMQDDTKDSDEDPNAITPPSKDYTGWVSKNGQKYWFDKGVLACSKEIYDPASKAWYWLDADGTMAHDKDVYLRSNGGKWVRYDSNGHMIKGEDCRYGGWYYFDLTTGAMAKGMRYISSNGGKWVYYDMITGKMAHGESYLNYDAAHTGWYYFHPQTGAVQYGFVYHTKGNKRVFYHRQTGKMLYGENCIDGGWYYMHPTTGALASGFTTVKGKRVYYDPSTNRMVHGPAIIANRPYFFDRTTGRQHTSSEIINTLVNKARSLRGKHPDCPGTLASNGGILCPYGPCMSFVWYLFHTTGYDVFLCNGGAVNGKPSGWPQHNYDWYARNGRVHDKPKVGDIVFWKFPDAYWATSASHAGFVVSVSGSRVMVVDAAFGDINERQITWSRYPGTPKYATPFYG